MPASSKVSLLFLFACFVTGFRMFSPAIERAFGTCNSFIHAFSRWGEKFCYKFQTAQGVLSCCQLLLPTVKAEVEVTRRGRRGGKVTLPMGRSAFVF